MKKFLLYGLFFLVWADGIAQVTGTVFVARKNISTDPARGISVYMDGQFFCELGDNTFLEHRTDIGSHKFGIGWSGSSSRIVNAIEINVNQSTEYYLRIYAKEGANSLPDLTIDQVAGNAWPKLMTGLDEENCN